MLAMAKKAKEEKAAEEERVRLEAEQLLRAQQEMEAAAEKKRWEALEAAAAKEESSAYEFDDVIDGNVVDDDYEEEEAEMSALDILFQFIPYYGQGDPTNDATVRSYLSSLSISEIDTKDEYGNTLLLLACQFGCDDLVRIMLNKGGDPNAVNSSGASGLHFACYRESMNKKVAKMLLHNGANPDLEEFVNGCTPLHYCASTGDVQFCDMLVNYGADVGKQDFYQYTCLDYAREAGFTDVAGYLERAATRGFNSPGGFASPGAGVGAYSMAPASPGAAGGMMSIPAGPGTPMAAGRAVDPLSPELQPPLPSDPAVMAALAEAEDKHNAALKAQRDDFRAKSTELDAKIAQLKTDKDMYTREIASFEEEIAEKKKLVQRSEEVGSANIEEVQKELEALKKELEELEREKATMLEKKGGLQESLKDAESKLSAVSSEDAARIASERAEADQLLVMMQEREKLYNVELLEMEGKYRDELESLKKQLTEEKRSSMQEERANATARGALQREMDKQSEAVRRKLHEMKTKQAKERTSLTFNMEDAEARATAATSKRDSVVESLRLTKKDIDDAKEAEGFNKEIQGYITKEQTVRRTLHNQMEDLKGKIRVYVRVRPMSKKEKDRGCTEVASKEGKNGIKLQLADSKKLFDFDQVFTGVKDNSQSDIFRDSKHLVMSVVDGYNVCIFAYGQTGSGKTFTMIGGCSIEESVKKDGEFHDAAGIAPRAVSELFRLLNERGEQSTFTVDVTMFQIYRDGIQDLLRKKVVKKKGKKGQDEDDDVQKDDGLKITLAQHSSSGLVTVDGAVVESASTPSEVMQIFAEGSARRKVASTQMNAESSRSHLVCSLVVNIVSKNSGKKTTGKLTLVDLAGSERVDKSGATGEAFKEAQSINKSLSALGDVISSLTSGSAHIPYRNHTLTMLMSDSIGGNAKTLMFVNTSPADYNSSETSSSLAFGNRCRDITNAVAAPPHVQAAQLKSLQKELAKMKKAGGGAGKKGPTLAKPGR